MSHRKSLPIPYILRSCDALGYELTGHLVSWDYQIVKLTSKLKRAHKHINDLPRPLTKEQKRRIATDIKAKDDTVKGLDSDIAHITGMNRLNKWLLRTELFVKAGRRSKVLKELTGLEQQLDRDTSARQIHRQIQAMQAEMVGLKNNKAQSYKNAVLAAETTVSLGAIMRSGQKRMAGADISVGSIQERLAHLHDLHNSARRALKRKVANSQVAPTQKDIPSIQPAQKKQQSAEIVSMATAKDRVRQSA